MLTRNTKTAPPLTHVPAPDRGTIELSLSMIGVALLSWSRIQKHDITIANVGDLAGRKKNGQSNFSPSCPESGLLCWQSLVKYHQETTGFFQ